MARAQHNLGVLYGNGEGVAQNLVEALKWFLLARELGHQSAGDNIEVVSRLLTPQDVVRAKTLAHQWLRKRPE
jgi:hypothetical protein